MARVGCPEQIYRKLMFNISLEETGSGYVSFSRIYFLGVVFYTDGGRAHFQGVTLQNSGFISENFAPLVDLTVHQSTWIGKADTNCTVTCMLPSSHLLLKAGTLRLRLSSSSFYQTAVKIMVSNTPSFLIENCTFSNKHNTEVVLGGVSLEYGGLALGSSVVRVVDSVFERQFHVNPIPSIMNLFDAALVVNTYNQPTANVSVQVERCRFADNERGVSLIGHLVDIKISGCSFEDNVAMHAGSALLLITTPDTPCYVINSTFERNSAGSYREDIVMHHQDSFHVHGDEVTIVSACCNGMISFVGKGGAIRIQKGNMELIDSVFLGNTARLLGGAVFVDRNTTLKVRNSRFQNSKENIHALQGDMLYSGGHVDIISADWAAASAKSHVAILRHSGDHWSMKVQEVSVQCPIGYRLRVTNTSAYKVADEGLLRSYALDQLSYFCESCPRNKYSMDHGLLNYSQHHESKTYFTLLVNGKSPENAYPGFYVYHDIECMPCPYGGKCQQGITAVANFWGYTYNNEVYFQHCPKGYCCTWTDCKTYDECGKHRTGRLCGECEEGFSEALFSSACVPDDNCDATWLFPMALGSGLLYMLFLLFQKDIRDFMFMTKVAWKELPCCRQADRMHRKAASYDKKYDKSETNNLVSLKIPHDVGDTTVSAPDTEMKTFGLCHSGNGVPGITDGDVSPLTVGNDIKKENIPASEEESPPEEAPVDTGASFLIILFYYFQDAQLLHIKTVFTSSEHATQVMLREILAGLFKFRVEVFQFMDKLCFISGITPKLKLMYKVALVPYVLLQFGVMFMFDRWYQKVKGPERSSSESADGKTFLSRLATGFVLSLLFTYQMLATTSFTLLNCVPVGDENVLFIEGAITCYQPWQYGVMAYAGSCIVPFCLALLIGPGLLKDGLISLPQFFFACLLPLPFLVYWVSLRVHMYLRNRKPHENVELSSEAQSVIQILQGPFKVSESPVFGSLCGAGILIGRRLILILLFTFVNDTLIRMLCMMLLCFIVLLHHVHMLPYKDTRCNLAGTASATALVIVCGINLVRAGFEAAEYIPRGPNMLLMQIFQELENVLMLWFPAFVMSIVILSLTVKLFLLFIRKACGGDAHSPANNSSCQETDI